MADDCKYCKSLIEDNSFLELTNTTLVKLLLVVGSTSITLFWTYTYMLVSRAET